jgi:vacuolar-type H+-ATPase subunit E/Vma4
MTTSSAQPLEPLRQALLRRADAAADATRAAARRAAADAVDAAQRDAAATLARARAAGDADAAQLQDEDRRRSSRAARGIVLAAQRAMYDELHERARAALRELLADPDRHRQLVAMVALQLGPHATVQAHPAGGVVGETSDGRRVDASVDVLVERALADLDLEPLWAP